MWRLGIFSMGGTMWSVSWAGATSPLCGWPGTSSKCTYITEIAMLMMCEFVSFKPIKRQKDSSLLDILYICKVCPRPRPIVAFKFLFCACFCQRKAICGYEGCKKCWTLYRDRSGWDQAAEVCKSHKTVETIATFLQFSYWSFSCVCLCL